MSVCRVFYSGKIEALKVFDGTATVPKQLDRTSALWVEMLLNGLFRALLLYLVVF